MFSNKTGNVLFHKEIDTIPNIVHNVHDWEEQNLKEQIVVTDKELKERIEKELGYEKSANRKKNKYNSYF